MAVPALGVPVTFTLASFETDTYQDLEVPGSRATAYAYKLPLAASPAPGQAGYVWAGVDAEICIGASAPSKPIFTGNNSAWTLHFPDNTLAEPSPSTYDSFPKPEFPAGDISLYPGKCVRGWIVYPVPGSARPNTLEFDKVAGQTLTWPLP